MSRKGQNVAFDWDEAKPSAGEEPALAKFDYFKLRETLETIVAAMEATAEDVGQDADTTEADTPSKEPDAALRLVVSNAQPENQSEGGKSPPTEDAVKLPA